MTSRRRFVGGMAGLLGAVAARPGEGAAPDPCDVPAPIGALQPLPGEAVPIAAAERERRIEKARRLMAEHKLDAILLEPGSSLSYFFGAAWGLSERPFLGLLPARGQAAFVCPGFEEGRAREQVGAGTDLRVWQEDESPYALLAGILRDRGLANGRIGIEEQLRFFVFDGVRGAQPQATLTSATTVVGGCRRLKSAAELALMQRANDVALAALRAAFGTLSAGMSQSELSRNVMSAVTRLGGGDAFALAAFGPATAFPHGTVKPQSLREGDVVLIDMGCDVAGYQADITRTTVFGKPTPRQTEIWNLERRAQDAAFAAARVGASCESVDAAARRVITDAGFGPDYKRPGLPHRTGHGIGMDGHEAPNFVRGEKTPLEPGMCFSDEPTIVIDGEFGIRLEDCLYITENGPRFFTPQSPAIDRPFA